MLDIKFIRENPEKVKKGAEDKGVKINIDEILQVDKEVSVLKKAQQELFEERNKAAKAKDIEKGKEIKKEIDDVEAELKPLEENLNIKLVAIPNPGKPDVKVGKDASENEVLRNEGSPRKFDFKPLDHLDLGEKLGIIDVKSAAKVSGARFAYLKGDAVLLEFALIQFGLEMLTKEGFVPVIPPVLIRQNITQGLGYWQAGGNGDYYLVYDPVCPNCNKEIKVGSVKCENCNFSLDPSEYPGFYLIGTAEHALVPMHKDEILNAKDLPKRYVGFSTAFRRESGSYGKDTKGILRVHQFDKLEMVSFVKEGEDDKEHEYLLSLEERLFKALEIPYQVVKMCTGDLGFPAARKYDLEAWLPGQNKYREVTSVSTVTDFQSRRLNIKYVELNGTSVPGEAVPGETMPGKGSTKKYVSILNGTGFAIGRTIIAILENYQEEDGSIRVPEVLQKYMGGLEKIVKK